MALIGEARWDVDVKLYSGGDWPDGWDGLNEDAWTQDAYKLYSGQGFFLPFDTTWVNRHTGTETNGGMVMGFPRSAEPQPDQDGTQKWYLSES